jgi:hypothetical protein
MLVAEMVALRACHCRSGNRAEKSRECCFKQRSVVLPQTRRNRKRRRINRGEAGDMAKITGIEAGGGRTGPKPKTKRWRKPPNDPSKRRSVVSVHFIGFPSLDIFAEIFH